MKYIMFRCERPELTQRIPFIFTDNLVHRAVAQYMGQMLMRMHGFATVTPVSAGNITWENGHCQVYGESTTLGLRHDPDDARTIDTYNYTHGLV